MINKKSKGRPTNKQIPEIAKKDEAIGKTISCLVWWGFKHRDIYDLVAVHSASILNRTDSDGLPLSAEMIKKVYESFEKDRPSVWSGASTGRKDKRKRYSRTSLYERCPDKTKSLEDWVIYLLERKGINDLHSKVASGDRELVKSAAAKLHPYKFSFGPIEK